MKKTIVFLHPHFLKPAGASKVVLEFASRLQKKSNFEIKIITIATSPKIISPYPNINFINLGGPTTGSLLFWITFPFFLFRLHKTVNKIPNKIIFAHSLAIYWTIFLPDSVLYFHDLGFPYSDSSAEKNSLPIFYRLFSYITTPIFSLLNHILIKSKNRLIANSEVTSQFIFHKYRRRPEAIISPGIETKDYHISSKKSNYFYTVGRLEKIKQINIIIKAFASLNNPKYRLKIIGEGVERQNLIKLAKKLKIQNQVDFLGKLNSHQVAAIASKALIGIFNCPNESFGLSILESLASGTPVITINKGGGTNFITSGSNGYLSNGTPQSISMLIPKILTENLSSNTRKSIQTYDWKYQIEKLSKYFSINS